MPALPSSLTAILSLLRPAFTAPTFEIFGALVAGMFGRIGEHTVTGMWQAARLAGRLHHSRAHDFFARAAWCPDRLGLLLLDFLLERFTDPDSRPRLAGGIGQARSEELRGQVHCTKAVAEARAPHLRKHHVRHAGLGHVSEALRYVMIDDHPLDTGEEDVGRRRSHAPDLRPKSVSNAEGALETVPKPQ